jgi:hypothetical protein
MRKTVLFIILTLMFTLAGNSQSKFKGFLKPDYKPDVQVVSSGITGENTIKGTWNFRPTFGLQALAFYYDKDLKELVNTSFNKMGIGIRYQHYSLSGGEVVGDYSINAILFSDFLFNGVEKTTFTPAVTFNALKYLNAGIAYDGQLKKPLFLTALTYDF